MAPRMVHDALIGKSTVIFRTPDAADADVEAVARTIALAGGAVTGTVTLTAQFVDGNAEEKLRTVLESGIVPAGAQLSTSLIDQDAQAGDLLGIALLINRNPTIVPTDDAARDTVLAALRDTGFVTYHQERFAAANAAVVITGGALPEDAGTSGLSVARFAAALAPHGSATVLRLPSGETILFDAGQSMSPEQGARTVADCLWSQGVARLDAVMALMRARQQLLAFLLRHGRTYEKGKNWTQRHRVWLAGQVFDQPVHQIVFQDYVETIFTAQDRRDQLVTRIEALLPTWSMGPVVEALRGLRGLELISAVTFVAGIGDLRRFYSPSQLMAYLGLVPSERSSGDNIRRGGITKTGNREARRMLVEAAWSYRYPPRVAQEKVEVLVRLPKPVRDIAWKAQSRLCDRFRKLSHSGKKPTVVVAAIARELAGFVWAIGQEVRPAAP